VVLGVGLESDLIAYWLRLDLHMPLHQLQYCFLAVVYDSPTTCDQQEIVIVERYWNSSFDEIELAK